MKTQKSIPQKIWAVVKGNPIVVMLAVLSLVVGCTIDRFFSLDNLNNLMCNTTVRFLIALGVSGCLITKGTDLSAGRQAALAATLTGVMVQRADYASRMFSWMPEMNMWLVLLIVLAIGAIIGSITGVIVSYLNVPPFIATLGVQTIVYGFNLIYTNAQPIGGFSESFKAFFNWKVLPMGSFKGFNGYILFALLFGVLFWFMYNKTTHGKYIYAIGGNENAAHLTGTNVAKIKFLVYTFSGFTAALAGVMLASRLGSANPGQGDGYEFYGIASAVVAGASMAGGNGTVWHTLIGALVITILRSGLNIAGIPNSWQMVVLGLVIVGVVFIDVMSRRKK